MTNPTILVTGATGKTGSKVIEQLRASGTPVRAFVRKVDERSEHIGSLGAEVVVGDFLDLVSVRQAMQGIKKVYFCYPPRGGRMLDAAFNAAKAARDESIELLVNMSQMPAHEHTKSPLSRHHWMTEQMFDWARVGAVLINPTYFSEDLYLFTGGAIAREGKLILPWGNGKHAPVSAEDIARVVVGILTATEPEEHIGKRYVIAGERNMSGQEMAGVLTKVLGKPIEYVSPPISAWRKALEAKGGFGDYLIDHLCATAQDYQDGIFEGETDIVARIGGQPPQSLENFVRSHLVEFTS